MSRWSLKSNDPREDRNRFQIKLKKITSGVTQPSSQAWFSELSKMTSLRGGIEFIVSIPKVVWEVFGLKIKHKVGKLMWGYNPQTIPKAILKKCWKVFFWLRKLLEIRLWGCKFYFKIWSRSNINLCGWKPCQIWVF